METPTHAGIASANAVARPSAAPVDEALSFTRDRLDRVEALLNELTAKLSPVLAESTPSLSDDVRSVGGESIVTNAVVALGHTADVLGNRIGDLIRRCEL